MALTKLQHKKRFLILWRLIDYCDILLQGAKDRVTAFRTAIRDNTVVKVCGDDFDEAAEGTPYVNAANAKEAFRPSEKRMEEGLSTLRSEVGNLFGKGPIVSFLGENDHNDGTTAWQSDNAHEADFQLIGAYIRQFWEENRTDISGHMQKVLLPGLSDEFVDVSTLYDNLIESVQAMEGLKENLHGGDTGIADDTANDDFHFDEYLQTMHDEGELIEGDTLDLTMEEDSE